MFILPQYPWPIHLLRCFLVHPCRAAVPHRRKQRLHLLQGVGQLLGCGLEVLVQPDVRLPPALRVQLGQPFAKILAHQRVGVEVLRLLRADGVQQPLLAQPSAGGAEQHSGKNPGRCKVSFSPRFVRWRLRFLDG